MLDDRIGYGVLAGIIDGGQTMVDDTGEYRLHVFGNNMVDTLQQGPGPGALE